MSAAKQRLFLPVLLALWAAFTAWCAWGFPPPVDLPAHGAQLQTLVNLLRGDAALRELYEIRVPIGYGLVYWLFLPVAFLWNGAVAVRAALWVALLLFPISQLALLRAFRRPDWLVLLGLPLAFNFSYWYGLLSGLFALPLALLTIAAFERAIQSSDASTSLRETPAERGQVGQGEQDHRTEPPTARDRRDGARREWIWLALVNLGAAATLQSHLVAFVALTLLLAVLALCHPPRVRSLRVAALGLALPLLISVPKIWSMAFRAVTPGPWPPTEFALMSHLNWFFRNYRPEGRLAAWGPVLVSSAMVLLYLRRRRKEPLAPAAMFIALLLLYLATPKTLSGIFLISVRLPVLAGMISLLLVDGSAIPKPLRAGLVVISLASLVETGVFHWRFARAIDGLDAMIQGPPPGRHGYWSLAGKEILGSRLIYLEHLGQWLTAARGGVGHNFFADAEHHPVRFKPGVEIPTDLSQATPSQLAQFDQILIFGEGQLPPWLDGFHEVARVKAWRKLLRQQAR